MEETRCIICGLEKDGIEVKEDFIINTIRWIKRNITRSEKGYRLVVCKECYPKYKKARDSYVRKELTYLAIGVLFAAMLVVFSGGHVLRAILYGAIIIVFMYLLAQLSYMPALKLPQIPQSAKVHHAASQAKTISRRAKKA
ncbi:MAG: hypothetical protein M1360_00925 [Candidatus Marsarchaeota archaeon]|jgi:hypothetical protein|nr:hypothetical protein [Candidatus Marsarchaeota archaeon]MCL5418489.1 hypothetical protein [Candidatus Marsarchaeota archaeon]